MKYYKIIKDNNFIGVINSNNFIQYQEQNNMFIGATPETGDLVQCDNKLYRSLWMKPMNSNISVIFEFATIKEITKEEYITFMRAIEQNQEIEDIDDIIPEPTPTPIIPDDGSIAFIRSSKLSEVSYACRQTIEAGFDLVLRGETRHFSLTTQDQLNLMSLGTLAQTEELIPYHADGEECEFYTPQEINEIIATAVDFKNYQLAYHNALKAYINALDTIEDIAAITYGTPIPDEYKSDVLRVLE